MGSLNGLVGAKVTFILFLAKMGLYVLFHVALVVRKICTRETSKLVFKWVPSIHVLACMAMLHERIDIVRLE